MLTRIILESVRRRKGRKILAILAILTGSGISMALAAVALNLGDKIQMELRSSGANIRVLPLGTKTRLEIAGINYTPPGISSFIPDESIPKILDIFWRNNILNIVPFIDAQGTIREKKVKLRGTWFTKDEGLEGLGLKKLHPWWKIKGHWPTRKNEILVGASIALKLGLEVGDQINFKLPRKQMDLSVSGIFHGDISHEQFCYIDLGTMQDFLGLKGKVEEVLVSALTTPEARLMENYKKDPSKLTPQEYDRWYCTPYPSSIAYQIEQRIGVSAEPIRQITKRESFLLTKLKGLIILLIILSVAASILGVTSAMSASIIERKKEMGVLKAIGASNISIVVIILFETGLLGLIGGLLGSFLGMGLVHLMSLTVFGTVIPWNLFLTGLTLLLGIGIALVGSLIPLRHVLSFNPAQVLHEQ